MDLETSSTVRIYKNWIPLSFRGKEYFVLSGQCYILLEKLERCTITRIQGIWPIIMSFWSVSFLILSIWLHGNNINALWHYNRHLFKDCFRTLYHTFNNILKGTQSKRGWCQVHGTGRQYYRDAFQRLWKL